MDVHNTSSNISRSSPTSSTDFSADQAFVMETIKSLETELFEPFLRQFSENERKTLSALYKDDPSESELKKFTQMKEFYQQIGQKLSDSFEIVKRRNLAISTNKADNEQDTRSNFHNDPSFNSSVKIDSNPLQQDSILNDDSSTQPYLSSSSENSLEIQTTDNGDTSLNNQDLCNGYSSALNFSGISFKKNKNIEVACNSHMCGEIPNQSSSKDFSADSSHISQIEESSFHSENNELTFTLNNADSLIDICVNREDDISISQCQNSTNNSPITPTGLFVFSPHQEKLIDAFSNRGFTRELAEEVVKKIGTKENSLSNYKSQWNCWYEWYSQIPPVLKTKNKTENQNPPVKNYFDFSAKELLQYLQKNNIDGKKSKPATINSKFVHLKNLLIKAGKPTNVFRDDLIQNYLDPIQAQIKEDQKNKKPTRTPQNSGDVNPSEQAPPMKLKLELNLKLEN